MQPEPITWTCDVCREVVDGSQGYIHVRLNEVEWVRRATEEAKAEINTMGMIVPVIHWLDLPSLAPWQVHHRECDPSAPDGMDEYWFDVERADTYPKLLDWTLHLMEKTWLPYTDWGEFVRGRTGVYDLT